VTVEQELRDVLADRAAHAPSADGLADAVVGRVRRGRQRMSVVGAAFAVGVALVGGVVVNRSGGEQVGAPDDFAVQPGSTAYPWPSAPFAASGWPEDLPAPVPNDDVPALVGRWTSLAVEGGITGTVRPDQPLAFYADGVGQLVVDPCLAERFSYDVAPDGAFTATIGQSTGCRGIHGDYGTSTSASPSVVSSATRIELDATRLIFLDEQGFVIGRFAREVDQP
jgi:hypothetical protein